MAQLNIIDTFATEAQAFKVAEYLATDYCYVGGFLQPWFVFGDLLHCAVYETYKENNTYNVTPMEYLEEDKIEEELEEYNFLREFNK